MTGSTFQDETVKVIRHLQRRLTTIVDTAESPELLKHAIIDYLESLLRAGPIYVDIEELGHPASRKDPPPQVPHIKLYPFADRNPRDPAQKMAHSPRLHRFSSPTDRETIFHGIRIPPGCDVIELPSIRPHVKDFFFVEGNVRHFVSVDNRPTSESSPSDRVMFHSTCPQRDISKLSSTIPRGYRIHKPYMAVCPMDARDYNVEDHLLENYVTPKDRVKGTTPSCCSQTALNECKIRRIVNIPEINACEGQGARLSSTDSLYDTYGRHLHYPYPEKLKTETHPPEDEEYYEKKLSPGSKGVKSHNIPCNHWSCSLRNAIGSQARSRNVDVLRQSKEGPREAPPGPLPKEEPISDCLANEVDFSATELANVQVKAEESISNYEKRLRQKYDTNAVHKDLEIEHTCNRRQDSRQHHTDVTEFEKRLNEKYLTKHTCGKEDLRLSDSSPLPNCDQVGQVKKETLASSSMSELDERIRGITEGVKQNSNDVEEDTTNENIGDETFMERMLRVDPVRPNCE